MRARMILISMLLAATSAVAQANMAGPAVIRLRPSAQTPSGEVTLDRLAAFENAAPGVASRLMAIVVTTAPSVGLKRVVSRDLVSERLASAGFRPEDARVEGADECSVTVQVAKVTAAQIVNAARSYLVASLGGERPGHAWEPVAMPDDRVVAAGATPPELAPAPVPLGETTTMARVFVRIGVDGDTRATVPVAFRRVQVRQNVVAARQIARGEVLTAEDVEIRNEQISDTSLAPQAFTDLSEAIGKQARLTIRPGQPIGPRAVAPPILIPRNAPVNIIIEKGSLRVVSAGVALADGRMRETLDVRVTATGRSVKALVTGPGEVVLDL